jgi:hypothetical protein
LRASDGAWITQAACNLPDGPLPPERHLSTIKAWHRAGLLTAHKANDKNTPLFDGRMSRSSLIFGGGRDHR